MNFINCDKPQNPGNLKSLVSHCSYLSNARWTKPVPIWNSRNLGPVAVGMAAFVTAVTEQKQFLVISLPADLAVLQTHESHLQLGLCSED